MASANTALGGGNEHNFLLVNYAPATVADQESSVRPVEGCAPVREKRIGTFQVSLRLEFTAIAAEYLRALARDLAFTLLAPVRARLQGC